VASSPVFTAHQERALAPTRVPSGRVTRTRPLVRYGGFEIRRVEFSLAERGCRGRPKHEFHGLPPPGTVSRFEPAQGASASGERSIATIRPGTRPSVARAQGRCTRCRCQCPRPAPSGSACNSKSDQSFGLSGRGNQGAGIRPELSDDGSPPSRSHGGRRLALQPGARWPLSNRPASSGTMVTSCRIAGPLALRSDHRPKRLAGEHQNTLRGEAARRPPGSDAAEKRQAQAIDQLLPAGHPKGIDQLVEVFRSAQSVRFVDRKVDAMNR